MTHNRPPPPAGPARSPPATNRGCWQGLRGLFLIASAVGVGALGWLVLNILAANLAREPSHRTQIAGFSRWLIDHRGYVPLLAALPGMVGLWMLLRRPASPGQSKSAGAWRWVILTLCSLWLLSLFLCVIVAFVMFIAPLYQYQDLG